MAESLRGWLNNLKDIRPQNAHTWVRLVVVFANYIYGWFSLDLPAVNFMWFDRQSLSDNGPSKSVIRECGWLILVVNFGCRSKCDGQSLSQGVSQVSRVVLAHNRLLVVASHVVPFYSCNYDHFTCKFFFSCNYDHFNCKNVTPAIMIVFFVLSKIIKCFVTMRIHSCKKCFCLREPIFWGGIFLILRRNFPHIEEKFSMNFPNELS